MKIRIVKAGQKSYWYSDKIGDVFEVTVGADKHDGYFVKYDGTTNVYNVAYKDCEEVIEHNSQLYLKVDRPVREGDTVLITLFNSEEVNVITTVTEVDGEGDFYVRDEPQEGCDLVFVDQPEDDEYFVLEAIEQPVQPSAPTYAEVSELLHEAKGEPKKDDDIITHNGKQYRKVKRKASVGELVVVTDFKPEKHIPDFEDTKNGDVFTAVYIWYDGDVDTGEDDGVILTPEEYSVLEPIEQSGQSETLTERDLLANLAKEVADIKRQLTNAKTDIADLEDRVDENEKDVEEVEQNLSEVIGRINDLGDGAEATAVVSVEVIKEVMKRLSVLVEESNQNHIAYKSKNDGENAYYFAGKSVAFNVAILKLKEALRNA